ncbi:MAG TPA: tungstate ABC transporter substrate-binding protein WtpA [Bacteroidales bacterium]|nr:tungstate ABC transporter substrate-binding protein WtpA [Bacteroidales bacterium]
MKRILLLLGLIVLLVTPGRTQEKPRTLTGDLVIFHAGSLSVPMKELSAAFKRVHPGVNILLESAGSVESARKVTDLGRSCDILASADYKVIDNMLIPKFASWNIKFVSNEMCLVFSEKSKYTDRITSQNWFDILLKKEVAYGRADPNSDPCGYRSVMTLQLAEKYYKRPGLTGLLMAKDANYMRPKEVDLLALLESNTVDYIFIYRSVAIQHQLKYLVLPDEINLKNTELADHYRSATVAINGKEPGQKVTMTGEPMVYGVALLNNAPHKEIALAFLEFMLTRDKGMAILEKNGQPSVIPQKNPNWQKLPKSLNQFATQ